MDDRLFDKTIMMIDYKYSQFLKELSWLAIDYITRSVLNCPTTKSTICQRLPYQRCKDSAKNMGA